MNKALCQDDSCRETWFYEFRFDDVSRFARRLVVPKHGEGEEHSQKGKEEIGHGFDQLAVVISRLHSVCVHA